MEGGGLYFVLTSVRAAVHGQVALVFRLVAAVVALEDLGGRPVLALHVTLQVDPPLEHLFALGAHLRGKD